MDARARLAWNLRRIRTAKGVTQEDLAVDADVDRTTISGIERSEYNPTIDILDRIASALSVDLSDLVAMPPEGEEPPLPLRAGRKPGK